MIKINLNRGTEIEINELPSECPYCHKVINPILFGDNTSCDGVELMFKCPSRSCLKIFIGYYYENFAPSYIYRGCNIGNILEVTFSEEIKLISPMFIKIYNESSFAEQNHLIEICGVGYRKAIEFLIKDYLIKCNPDLEKTIKKKLLGDCIKHHVSDQKIKKVAERAVWLGNDEAHYIRIWEQQSLSDLKKLISLTIHWIEMEELSNSFEAKMPNKK